ncbi:MAG: hypothetical protein D6778_00080 [Nitrospirae bacterium]|nr:MAG: hypothetical protein D6778_00080 [Nitrospirota bacterium]
MAYKVVFHINEPEKWPVLLGNVTNLLKDMGKDVEVRVLANGPSVKAYADEETIEKMKPLAEQGVKFLACRNSLKAFCSGGDVCIDEESLPDFVEVVPAGVSELTKRQAEGYAYIKP